MNPSPGDSERDLSQSKRWLARARAVVPGAAQTFSKGPTVFVQGAAPNFLARAQGAYAWDVDGNRYIDYIMGLGPVILGHGYPAVNDAVRSQLDVGASFSLPHPIEVEVSELLLEFVPWAQMVRFAKNGSDATSGAVRLARAFTGRDVVACCGYHGWQDWFIGSTSRSRGVPEAVSALTMPFRYNDLDALAAVFEAHGERVACVIMEPVAFTAPKPGFLEGVKELCRANSSLLIFDEVVVGFRMALGGAHARFGVEPDLACFGKAIANGFPLAAIVGRRDVMKLFEDVFFSFTFGGEAVSLAACRATLRELRERDVLAHLWRIGEQLKQRTNRLIEQTRLASCVSCVGFAPWTTLSFRDHNGQSSLLIRSLFQQEVLKRGVLTHGNHMLSLSHDETIVDETLHAYEPAFTVLADALRNREVEGRLEGPPVQAVFRQA
jgi:glutamate-1-semialdehyde-2,1-aminomutase